ncbi:YusW family protein [Planococcus antarcticus]|uniref:YusW family protein n=1 Tax=Planococcus antarcticus TaxID=161360 RepID=UPI0022AA97FC|nr:YusW family protein [Planococcus antarcticus]
MNFPGVDNEIEINYEENRDKVEAAYKNEKMKTNLAGNDAMAEIEGGLSQMELTPKTADEEVITQVIEAFGIEEGFTEIEVEVTYPDGVKKEYKQISN